MMPPAATSPQAAVGSGIDLGSATPDSAVSKKGHPSAAPKARSLRGLCFPRGGVSENGHFLIIADAPAGSVRSCRGSIAAWSTRRRGFATVLSGTRAKFRDAITGRKDFVPLTSVFATAHVRV